MKNNNQIEYASTTTLVEVVLERWEKTVNYKLDSRDSSVYSLSQLAFLKEIILKQKWHFCVV